MNCFDNFININIAILFILTIYIVFFYVRNNYNNYKKNIYEEIVLSLISIVLIYLYTQYRFNIFILTISTILLLEFDKYILAIYISILQLEFINLVDNIYIFLPIYIVDFILYFIYLKTNKNKMFLTNILVLINTVYLIIVVN